LRGAFRSIFDGDPMSDDSRTETLLGLRALHRPQREIESVAPASPEDSNRPLPFDGENPPTPNGGAGAQTHPQADAFFPWAGWRPDPEAADDELV
jgi:hypothetical protein